VAARVCGFCGKTIPSGAAFCPSCGAAVAAGSPLPASPGYGAPFSLPASPAAPWTPPGFPTPGGASVEDRRREASALRAVETAAIIALVGFAFSVAFLFAAPVSAAFGATTTGTGSNTTVHLSVDWTIFFILLGGSAAFTILQLVFYRSAFGTLMVRDARFRTPALLTILAIVGYVLLMTGLAILVTDIVSATNHCANLMGSAYDNCLFGGTFGGSLALVAVGGIVALIGFIGLLIGIWRLGSRYDDGLFKAGAVLLIFPILQLIGSILILVAAHDCRRKLLSGNPYSSRTFPR